MKVLETFSKQKGSKNTHWYTLFAQSMTYEQSCYKGTKLFISILHFTRDRVNYKLVKRRGERCLHPSQVAYQTRAYPGFLRIRQLGAFLLLSLLRRPLPPPPPPSHEIKPEALNLKTSGIKPEALNLKTSAP